MGVGLGWQRMHSSNPYISGQAWSDKVTRSGNNVSYSLNLCMKVEKASGYWDYVWYVDMQVGSNTSNNRKVKNNTSWHQIIGGKEYYQSTFNGNFTGSVNVSGKATSIQLRAQFHDSNGNRGPNVYWNVPIPAATSMDDIKKEVSGVGSDIASISAKVTKTGNYSTITSWKLEYGVRNYSENVKTISGNNLSINWLLENLLADTNYKYRITVSNSSGYSKQATGAFRTEEEVIGYRVTKGELIEPGVYEDGEASGEFVQIDNVYDNEGQITSVEMLGNAEQTTYEGKNLIDFDTATLYTNASVDSTRQGNGFKSTIKSATLPTYYDLNVTMPAGTYTLSFEARCQNSNSLLLNTQGYIFGGRGVLKDASGATASDAYRTLNSTWKKFSFTITTTASMAFTTANALHLYFLAPDSTQVFELQNPMFEAGSTRTDYEQYVGGTPAPNPDYPQPISVVTGEQTVQVTGRNLLPTTEDWEQTLNGVNIKYESGVYTFNGTSTSSGSMATRAAVAPYTIRSGDYFHYCNSFASSNINIQLFFTDGASLATSMNATNRVFPIDIYNGTSYVGKTISSFRVNFASGQTFNGTASPMILHYVSTVTSYEPYQGQSYEINLGKNLFDINSLATAAITVSDGVATGQGQHFYAAFGQNTNGVSFIKRGGQLSISLKAYTDGNQAIAANEGLVVRVIYTDGTSEIAIRFLNNQTTATTKTYTTVAGENVASVQLTYANNGGNIWHISEFQIEASPQPTPYSAYFTPIELVKVGNYQDRIYKNNGKWYIEKQIQKATFDGSSDESWALGTTGSLRYPFGIDVVGKGWTSSSIDGVMCNTFLVDVSSENDAAKQSIFTCRGTNWSNRMWFFCPKSAIAGSTSEEILASYKTFLSAHPTTVYYALATSTTTEITNETLIAQLEALGVATLYVGLNNVLVATNNVAPTLKIDYKLTVKEPVYDDRSDELVGWIIYPDGRKKKIKEIRRVYPT